MRDVLFRLPLRIRLKPEPQLLPGAQKRHSIEILVIEVEIYIVGMVEKTLQVRRRPPALEIGFREAQPALAHEPAEEFAVVDSDLADPARLSVRQAHPVAFRQHDVHAARNARHGLRGGGDEIGRRVLNFLRRKSCRYGACQSVSLLFSFTMLGLSLSGDVKNSVFPRPARAVCRLPIRTGRFNGCIPGCSDRLAGRRSIRHERPRPRVPGAKTSTVPGGMQWR